MRRMAALGALALAGCVAVTPVPFSGPNGRQAYSMRCSGAGRSMQECYRVAGQVCPRGYDIIDSSSSTVGVGTNGTFVAGPRREMAIECR